MMMKILLVKKQSQRCGVTDLEYRLKSIVSYQGSSFLTMLLGHPTTLWGKLAPNWAVFPRDINALSMFPSTASSRHMPIHQDGL